LAPADAARSRRRLRRAGATPDDDQPHSSRAAHQKTQVRNTAVSPEGLEEYMEFRAGTDLRWPYA